MGLLNGMNSSPHANWEPSPHFLIWFQKPSPKFKPTPVPPGCQTTALDWMRVAQRLRLMVRRWGWIWRLRLTKCVIVGRLFVDGIHLVTASEIRSVGKQYRWCGTLQKRILLKAPQAVMRTLSTKV